MKNFFKVLTINVLTIILLYFIFYSMMPQSVSENNSLSVFSTKRALKTIEDISAKPHYIGSDNHDEVANYLVSQLQKLGLQTELQEGFSMTEWGNLTKSKNIIAKINGANPTEKALLLLSHYDSAPHSFSHGASDDGSGIATILEGVRAFLYNKTPHKNDIIILFTDAEELGLNGASLFVSKHPWAKNIGLAINFEARGTAGPSYMLMESNNGNAALIDGFKNAKTKFPAANSLMYSIYKMLPNDTDLTVFREKGKIQGFNFAFIDDHFNYHTQQDDLAHLDKKSIEHNGSYLMPMLNYFSNSNLKKLNSDNDYIYFNTPFGFIKYPFQWIWAMWIVAFLLFAGFLAYGIVRKILDPITIAKGFLPFFVSIFATGIVTFLGWKLILLIYPKFKDILHGFTYNGSEYMTVFVLLSIGICFYIYHKMSDRSSTMNHFIAPLFIWIIINLIISIKLKGAGFFIIPVFFGLIVLGIYVFTQKTNLFLNFVLSIPAFLIYVPFIALFPVGLGLKMMFVSSILIALTFGLLTPLFNNFTHKKIWFSTLFALSFCVLLGAGLNAGFEKGKAKPNSLLYVYDANKNKAFYTTYDTYLDDWTMDRLGEKPEKATQFQSTPLYSKYGNAFTYSKIAPVIGIDKPEIEFVTDSISGSKRFLKIIITPRRKVNRYDIFANEDIKIKNLKGNGEAKLGNKISRFTIKRKVLSYYVIDNEPLEMEFNIDASKNLDMEMVESSFDLLQNSQLKIAKRQSWMMPMPFVLTDAVVLKQSVVPQSFE